MHPQLFVWLLALAICHTPDEKQTRPVSPEFQLSATDAAVAESVPSAGPRLLNPVLFPPCLTGIINNYTPVLGFGCDSSTLQVGTLNGFAAGDKVVLLQMQVPQVDLSNTANFGTPLNTTCIGNYEFNRIQSLNGTTIQLQFALTRSYDVSGKVQLVRVPEYDSATVCNLTCLPWNGTTGGVLALDVKNQLTLSGDMDVSGRGFRGGIAEPNIIPWVFGETQFYYPPVPTLAGAKGEGIVPIPTNQSFGRGRAGNGGGGGNAHNAGGGGGGNAGAGGNGGLEITNLPAAPIQNTDGIGGQRYFDTDPKRILLGGGAGTGHANDARGSDGGNGGGIMLVSANALKTNNFRLLANGIDVFGGQEQNDGQGGGGAGGTIVLKVAQVTGTLVCELKGGQGGSNPYTPDFQLHGPGGGGGGGKLLLTQNFPNIIPAIQGGQNGLTSQGFTHGAAPGGPGKVLTNIAVVQSTQPAHPVSNKMLLALQSPVCAGLGNGEIAVFQSTALAFRLNGGPWQPDSVFTNLLPGTYQIGLRFSGGCTFDTTATLVGLPPVLDSLLLLSPATCSVGGAIAVTAISGVQPFEYQLNNGAWQASGSFADVVPGNYTVTTRDAIGCSVQSAYTVAAPAPLLDSLLLLENAGCTFGGTISVAATTGISPFEYQLNNGIFQTTGDFTNLPPGNYTVTVRDGADCLQTDIYAIAAPPPVADSLLSLQHAGCTFGGLINIVAVSGTPPFEYQLNNSGFQPTGQFADLIPGIYNVVVRDAAGCIFTNSYTVDPPPPVLDSLLLFTHAGCTFGGTISVTATSGSPPFAYQLDTGAWQTTGYFPNLLPADYAITVRDAAGCMQTNSYKVNPPPQVSDSLLLLNNAGCITGGLIHTVAISGTQPFEYQLNNGTWQTTGNFPDLSPGDYSIMVRDALGCTFTNSYIITPPPPVLDSLLLLQNAGCTFGGALTVAATSGTQPFQYQLNNGVWQPAGGFSGLLPGNYTLVIQDAVGCTTTDSYLVAAPPAVTDTLLLLNNAGCAFGGAITVTAISGTPPFVYQLNNGIFQATGNFPNLLPGNYTIAVRDAAGCTQASAYTVAAPPPVADSLLSLSNAGCTFGGAIVVTAIAGTSPFDYQLNNGTWQLGGSFADLLPGDYRITVRDAVGCTHATDYTIAAPSPLLDSLLWLNNAGCTFGGSMAVVAISGTEPFEYQLNNGPWQSDGNFGNLVPGSYTIALRDAVGCTQVSSYTILPPPPVQDSLLQLNNAGCTFGGAISVTATSGTGPFTFQLDQETWQPNGNFSGLLPGTYTIAIQDAAGCTITNTYTIDAAPPVANSLISLHNAGCTFGGSLAVMAINGTQPFEYQLNNQPWQTNGIFPDLSPGSYTIIVRDAAGCTHSSIYNIAPPPPLFLQLDQTGNIDCRHATGFIAVAASGGSGDYAYVLDGLLPAQATGNFADITAGKHSITVTDTAGCTATLSPILIRDLVDTVQTQQTVTIYEGTYYQLPDGKKTTQPGQYVFAGQTVDGCDSVHVIDLIVLARHIYIPNVFHPDSRENGFFTVFSDASLALIHRLSIYDRWGELIFDQHDILPNREADGWDGYFRGDPVGAGVFVWVVDLQFVDGQQLTLWGDVTVIR